MSEKTAALSPAPVSWSSAAFVIGCGGQERIRDDQRGLHADIAQASASSEMRPAPKRTAVG